MRTKKRKKRLHTRRDKEFRRNVVLVITALGMLMFAEYNGWIHISQ